VKNRIARILRALADRLAPAFVASAVTLAYSTPVADAAAIRRAMQVPQVAHVRRA
jgi:hypothetical protein